MVMDNNANKPFFQRFLIYFVKIIIIFTVYFIAAKFGLGISPVSGFATLVWPPTGIALAVLFIFGEYRIFLVLHRNLDCLVDWRYAGKLNCCPIFIYMAKQILQKSIYKRIGRAYCFFRPYYCNKYICFQQFEQ